MSKGKSSSSPWPKRFVLWLDMLGTSSQTEEIIEKRVRRFRELAFECFETLLKGAGGPLYFIGDGLMLCSQELKPLLEGVRKIMHTTTSDHINNLLFDETFLLRGAIAKGPTGYIPYIPPGQFDRDKIRVMPMISVGFGHAFKLEGIRKGSRLYLHNSLGSKESLGKKVGEDGVIQKWKNITGEGRKTSEKINEYLWPASYYRSKPQELACFLKKADEAWRVVCKKEGKKSTKYNSVQLHYDETVKVCIRSCGVPSRRDSEDVQEALLSLLPKNGDKDNEFDEYRWGFWFLAIEALLSSDKLPCVSKDRVKEAMKSIGNGAHKTDFLKELEKSDYRDFCCRLKNLCPDIIKEPCPE